MKEIEITEKSKEVFLRHAMFAEFNGHAIVDVDNAERGNLSDLVKKGFIKLYQEEPNLTWMEFTKLGRSFSKDHGIEIDEYEDYSRLTTI